MEGGDVQGEQRALKQYWVRLPDGTMACGITTAESHTEPQVSFRVNFQLCLNELGAVQQHCRSLSISHSGSTSVILVSCLMSR
jgi:hypothetical protein